MSSNGTAPRATAQHALSLNPARAAASRRNGAKSKGPKSARGKARSAQNALKHGLCAANHAVLPDEDGEAFAALEASLVEELAPEGALQRLLASRIARAAWRLERAERIEAELFEERRGPGHWAGAGGVALALIRDGNSTGSFDTLLRYRGSALAELWRALRTLKALQAEQALQADPAPSRSGVASSTGKPPEPAAIASPTVAPQAVAAPAGVVLREMRNEPEVRRKPADSTLRTVDSTAHRPAAERAVPRCGSTASKRR